VATYIALINWTDQGVQHYQDSPARADAFATMVEGDGRKRPQPLLDDRAV
jgi:uncharacterized protein with GYD domain